MPTFRAPDRRGWYCCAASMLAAGLLLAAAWSPPTTGRLLWGGYRLPVVVAVAGLLWLALMGALAARSRLWLLRALLGTAAAAVTWVFAEAVNAVVQAVPARAAASPLGGTPLRSVDMHGSTPPDIAHVWGLPCEPYRFHFQTNAWGFRNVPDRQQADVLCLGDSLLVAIQLPMELTTTGLLEQRLQRPVANVCLVGKAPQEMLTYFDALALALDLHGRVVLQFVCEDNDLLDSLALANGASSSSAGSSWRHSLFHEMVLNLQRWTQPVVAEARRRTGRFRGQDVMFLWHHRPSPELDEQIPVICEALARFAAGVRQRGAHYGVVIVPSKLRIVGPACELPDDFEFLPIEAHCSRLHDALLEWGRNADVPVLSLDDVLRQVLARGELPWLTDDTHLSAPGHAAVVNAILAWEWFRSATSR
ncbi:MAG TPA: hypothetical protein VF384_11780 [Planctomycetota bacterium]